jgi:hypothetical protein
LMPSAVHGVNCDCLGIQRVRSARSVIGLPCLMRRIHRRYDADATYQTIQRKISDKKATLDAKNGRK